MSHFVLRKSISGADYGSTREAWSGGTRVEILRTWTEPDEIELADVQIMAGEKPTLFAIHTSDLVERGRKRGPRPQKPIEQEEPV